MGQWVRVRIETKPESADFHFKRNAQGEKLTISVPSFTAAYFEIWVWTSDLDAFDRNEVSYTKIMYDRRKKERRHG